MNGRPLFESPDIRTVTGPAVRPGGLSLTERAVRFCNLPRRSMVIDVGCGLGTTVHYLTQQHAFRAVGLDASPGMIQEGRQLFPDEDLLLGRADRLPFPDGSAYGIFCECVLSLMDDPSAALAEFHRVLAPDGRLVLTDVYLRNPGQANERDRFPVRCCLQGASGKDFLWQRIRAARFQVLLWEDHSDLLKRLAAGIVWHYGSMNHFWQRVDGRAGHWDPASEFHRTRPGYFLLAARKEAES